MQNERDAGEVVVTQEDRDAAADLIRKFWNGTGKHRDIMHMVADEDDAVSVSRARSIWWAMLNTASKGEK